MDICLKKSIKQYQRIIAHAGQLDLLLLKSDPDELQNYTVRLQELQGEAELNDQIFLELFPNNSARLKNHPLFLERTRLLKEIVELNHLLLPKISGIMAVTADELSQVKSGRAAVPGYHQPPTQPKQFPRWVG